MASYYQRSTHPRRTAAAQSPCNGASVIVAAGGDGTVSAAASALAATDAALGVLPLGTLNHFAKDIGVPLDLGKAAESITRGRTVTIDVGDLNGSVKWEVTSKFNLRPSNLLPRSYSLATTSTS
jgi:diacylglycerol kinase family enzyme